MLTEFFNFFFKNNLKVTSLSSTSADYLSCKTHTSSETFTIQQSMPVFIAKGILNFTFCRNKATDLRIEIAKPCGNAYRKPAVEIVKM